MVMIVALNLSKSDHPLLCVRDPGDSTMPLLLATGSVFLNNVIKIFLNSSYLV